MITQSESEAVSRRSFLFTLVAVTCLGRALPAGAYGDFKPFSFGYVTDAHLTIKQPDSYKLLQQSQLFLQDCVKALNNLKPDFVIFGGDQVEGPGKDDSNWQLFADVAQVLNCPWSFVLGETDVSGNTIVDKMRTFGPDWKGKGIETDKPYWSQTPLPGVHLIGLDTSRPNSTTGDISAEQLEWLKNDLSENGGKFTIVFSHHPLLAPPPFDTGPPWDDYLTAQGDTVREILNRYGDVRLAVSGHLHVSKIQRERDIWYISSPSLDVYPCEYRFFRVTPESITVETYQVSFPALVKKARLALDNSNFAFKYNENRKEAFAELAAGTRADQASTLSLRGNKAVSTPVKRGKKSEKHRKETDKKEHASHDRDGSNADTDEGVTGKHKHTSKKTKSKTKHSDSDNNDAASPSAAGSQSVPPVENTAKP